MAKVVKGATGVHMVEGTTGVGVIDDLLAVEKAEEVILEANGRGRNAELDLRLVGSAHNPLKISVGRVHKITPKISQESPECST